MKKIEFLIQDEEYTIFIAKEHVLKIQNLSGRIEQGGYIFISKIKDANEYIVEILTNPQKKDICTENFVELSKKHKRIARKIKNKNTHLYEAGFYHTHPESFGCNASKYDLNYFSSTSENYKISLFIIGVKDKVNILVYSYGKKVKKEIIWSF